jgi:hypothetical protein
MTAMARPYGCHYAAQSRQANGARRVTIILVTGEPPRGYPRSVDWIELVLQADGSGTGFESYTCELGLNHEGNDIELKTPGVRKALITIFKD